MQWAKQKNGFTIVELLIVVVVIAILAAITIVSYNGVTRRAQESVAQNSVTTAQKKLASYYIDNADQYPASIEGLGLVSTNNVKYQYSVNNSTSPSGYCVTVTSGQAVYRLGVNYTYLDGATTSTINDSKFQTGVCPGHTSTGNTAIANYVYNPNVEVSKTGLGQPNGSTVERSTVRAYFGTGSAITTLPNGASAGSTGLLFFQENPFTTLKPNTLYTVSAYVYVPAATTPVRLVVQGSGRTSTSPTESYLTAKDQWVRIWATFTTLASGSVTVYVLNTNATTTAGTQFWTDGMMITEGETLYNYADGDSPNWIWQGTPGLTQSSGPVQ